MNFDPTYDYGLSDLTNEDNLVCWKFGELIKTLVTLSSKADRQIENMGAGIVTNEMAYSEVLFKSLPSVSCQTLCVSVCKDRKI